jgi:adenylate kinase
MFVALTGTPGTGKTTVGHLLSTQGYRVIHLTDIEKKCVVGMDTKRGCHIYDIKLLDQYLHTDPLLIQKDDDVCIIEGQLSHLLSDVSNIIILRCHPEELQKRLESKGYASLKIQENLEAEALDIILCDAACCHAAHAIHEIDTTHKDPVAISWFITQLLQDGFQGEIGHIDWSNWIEKNVG